ncbi:DUF6090 family protein [Robiginitalea sp. IMCC44478]|uniref:DUF6090 family protein n=1 Tax=Robiginitalea sp. IMCC44478 TaxID=3459122 RepID=UPI0040432519
MFRFFRKIRQRLIINNKVSKYLLYAIGEILLVVIGILIALQVDSWNEERKIRADEQILLRKLKDDYTANLEQLDSKITTRKVLIRSSKELLTFFDNPQSANKDSVLSKLGNLGLTVTYDPINNDLIASGKINIIQNEELKTLLTKWSTDVIQVQEVENIYINAHHYENVPVMNKFGIGRAIDKALYDKANDLSTFLLNREEYIPYDFKKSRLEPSLEAILNNAELEGIVANSILINEIVNAESFTLRKQILEILDLLRELDQNKE